MKAKINIITVLLFFVCLNTNIAPMCAQNKKAKSDLPFFFIQLSDPQFGFFDENKGCEKEVELYTKAVSEINRLNPEFVVITGDLVNDKSNNAQIAAFKEITAKINKSIPVHLIPGNHDVGQDPQPKDLEFYKKNYGDDRFSFSHNGTLFIGVNSSFIKAKTLEKEEQQYKWLKKELSQSKKFHNVLVFSHYPFFISNVDEPEEYSNIGLDMRDKYLKLFKKHHVSYVFAGHYHNNAYAQDGNLQMIITSAVGKPLGKAPSGMRIISVYPKRIEHNYYALDSIPQQITLK